MEATISFEALVTTDKNTERNNPEDLQSTISHP
jgi:hypothetical protein